MSPIRRGRQPAAEPQKPPFVSKAKVLLLIRQASAKTGNTMLQRSYLEVIKAVQDLPEVE